MSGAKTIKVRCVTWEQVESFYTEKLRGNAVVVKMPYRPEAGEQITVALGLPDGVIFAIEGTVVKTGQDEAGKVPVALRLAGLGGGVRDQLERLVAAGRSAQASPVPAEPEPHLPDIVEGEEDLVAALDQDRMRLAALPAHDVLGVAADADLAEVRRAWLGLARRHHPDFHARWRSPAARRLVEEIFLRLARAYDRMREAAPATARLPGAAFGSRLGWLAAIDSNVGENGVVAAPVQAEVSAPYSEIQMEPPPRSEAVPVLEDFADEVRFTTSVRMKALTAEELFDDDGATRTDVSAPAPAATSDIEAGRAALAASRWRDACQSFAAALRLDPRNRAVRALYHVANGLELRALGDGARALLQFETALAHDRDCEEARRALAQRPDTRKIR